MNRDEDVKVVTDLLRVLDMLMPGLKYIAIQDYALLNDAVLRARAWVRGQQVAAKLERLAEDKSR